MPNNQTGYPPAEAMRAVAREEIASLCGLVLRRVSETYETKDAMRIAEDDALRVVASIFGEALRDFGGTTQEPGTQT